MVNKLKDSRKRRAPVVCRIRDIRDEWFSALVLSSLTSSMIGLFQISVKLPHEPYKIQVMVGDDIETLDHE
jgi:protein TIF31